MKITEALKIIDEGWVRKRKGFRVHFQKKVNSEFVTDYLPNMEEKPLDSDVVTWRLAWKLSQATKTDNPESGDDNIVNIFVVDESGNPEKFYGTNRPEVFNPMDTE